MAKFFKNPLTLFFWISPILIIVGFISRNTAIDINVHDTYFVFTKLSISIVLSVGFVLIGLTYLLLEKIGFNFSKILIVIHFLFAIYPLVSNIIIGEPEVDRYYTNTSFVRNDSTFIILGLLIFGANLIYGLIKRTSR